MKCLRCGNKPTYCNCPTLLNLPLDAPQSATLIVREVVAGKFHQNRSATNDLVTELKVVIYKRTGVLSVAEVLGVLRCIEHEILQEQP